MANLIFQGQHHIISPYQKTVRAKSYKFYKFISGKVSQENFLLFAGLTDVNNVGEEVVMVRFVNDLAELIWVLKETDEDLQTV